MSNLLKLRDDHARLARIARDLRALIRAPHPPSIVSLYTIRRRLSSTLIAHLKAEDWVLYPRLMQCADTAVAEIAREFAEEMGGLADAFTDHNEHWTAQTINSDWPGYCAATAAILDALDNRIARENRDLYPLLEALDKAA